MKIIGSILILISAVTISYYYERWQRQSINNQKNICKFLEFIKNQIEFFSMPLLNIYEKYKDKNDCINLLINGKFEEITPSYVQNELKDCFSQLGTSYKDEQIKILNCTIENFKDKIKSSEKNYEQKIKVFRAISLFIGCSAVILLV